MPVTVSPLPLTDCAGWIRNVRSKTVGVLYNTNTMYGIFTFGNMSNCSNRTKRLHHSSG